MEEYCKSSRLLYGEYKHLSKLYPKNLLDTFFSSLKIYPDDFALMDKIYAKILPTLQKVNTDILREVTLISVMGNDASDATFIEQNPQLCKRCGWCCRNCSPILVTPDEVRKIGSKFHVKLISEPGEKKVYSIKLPCHYQLKDNSCGIYKNRPSSCKVFPIGKKHGVWTVQRSIHCEFIEACLTNKATQLVNKLLHL